MRILFASSEAYPLVKTGGLADVSTSLSSAMREAREDIRMVLPAYPRAKTDIDALHTVATLVIDGVTVQLLQGILPATNVPTYLVDAPEYFAREGHPYCALDRRDWQDNHLRFALFARVVVAMALNEAMLNWQPQIVHCNDWQTGLVPALLSQYAERPASVFTIHNLAYQGLFPAYRFAELGLAEAFWSYHGLEFHNQLSFIKGGLSYADHVTTVSPSYAREIRTGQFGYGLEGLLNYRAQTLSGILNGVDYRHWDPRWDSYIKAHYSPEDLQGKTHCKQALQERFGIEIRPEVPLLGHIGRMVPQKGMDLILKAVEPLLAEQRVQMVLLGSGDKALEAAAQALAARFPEAMGVCLGYNEALAHQLEAGCDMFLMPSRFEPCGLNQMYSLRYGTIPIVRRTGGLADTVVDTLPETLADHSATGFVFEAATAPALATAIERALSLYQDGTAWTQLMRQAMSQDFSWAHSAQQYLELYASLLGERAHWPATRWEPGKQRSEFL